MNITIQVVKNPDQIADDLRQELNSAFAIATFSNEKVKQRLTSLLEEILDRTPTGILLDCARSVSIVEAQVVKNELKELEDLSLVFDIGSQILKFRDSGVPPVIAALALKMKHTGSVDFHYIDSQVAMAYKLW
jgi:hypothetical protein